MFAVQLDSPFAKHSLYGLVSAWCSSLCCIFCEKSHENIHKTYYNVNRHGSVGPCESPQGNARSTEQHQRVAKGAMGVNSAGGSEKMVIEFDNRNESKLVLSPSTQVFEQNAS